MNINRFIKAATENGILRTWTTWSELLARPDASPFVVSLDQASDELIRIFDRGFPVEEMEAWLREWPTLEGWEVFYKRRECGLRTDIGP